jgi:hypothetical protein
MPYSIHARRLTPPRARLLTAAALLSGLLVAGCGGGSKSPTGGASTSPPSNPTANSGVIGSGGYYLAIPKSIDTNSPAFHQAAAACNFGPGR